MIKRSWRALYLYTKGGDPQFFSQFLVVLGHMKPLARYGQKNVSILNFIQQKVQFSIENNDKWPKNGRVLYLIIKGGDPQFFPRLFVALGHRKLPAKYGRKNVLIYR